MHPETQQSMSREIARLFSSRAVWALLGMLSGLILARWLGPHDRGILALVLLLPSTAVTLVKLGISQSNVYFINRERAAAADVASNAVVLGLLVGLVSTTAVWLARDHLQTTVLRGVPTWALAIAIIRIPFLLVDGYLYGALQAVGRFQLYNNRLILGEILRFLLIVVTLVVLDQGIEAAVVVQTFVTLVNVGWLVVSTRRVIPFGLRVNRTLLGRQLSFGAKSWVQTVTSHLLLRIDVYMVAYYLDPSQTAFYALALRFTEMALEAPQAVGLVLYPRLATMEEEKIHKLTAQACRRTLAITGVIALAMATLGPTLIELWYGSDYAPAGDPLPWAAIGVAVMSIFMILTRNFTSRNRQQVNIGAGVLALGSNIVLNILLIPRYGIVGAAVATAVSYSLSCLLLLVFFLAVSRLPLLDVMLVKREDLRYFWETGRRATARLRRVLI